MFDTTFILLAAERQPWEQLRDTMRQTGQSPWTPLFWAAIGLLLAILLVMLVMSILDRRRRETRAPNPVFLFHRLAGDLGVSWRDQWLLVRIARQEQLPSAIVLLITPGTFEHYTQRYLESRNALQRRSLATRLEGIREGLFEE